MQSVGGSLVIRSCWATVECNPLQNEEWHLNPVGDSSDSAEIHLIFVRSFRQLTSFREVFPLLPKLNSVKDVGWPMIFPHMWHVMVCKKQPETD